LYDSSGFHFQTSELEYIDLGFALGRSGEQR